MAKPTKSNFDFVKTYNCKFATNKKLIIILDAAHGKDVPGKRSPDGKHLEYKWSREIIAMLGSKLKNLGYKVHQTNETDNEIGLTKRKNIADSIQGSPKLLLSIHNNAAGSCGQWMSATGLEFYTSKGQTLSDVFAEACVRTFKELLPDERMRADTVDGDSDKESNFTVLMGNTYYACLAEIMFQDNKHDVELLQSSEFKQKVVDAFVNAIELFNTFLILNTK